MYALVYITFVTYMHTHTFSSAPTYIRMCTCMNVYLNVRRSRMHVAFLLTTYPSKRISHYVLFRGAFSVSLFSFLSFLYDATFLSVYSSSRKTRRIPPTLAPSIYYSFLTIKKLTYAGHFHYAA